MHFVVMTCEIAPGSGRHVNSNHWPMHGYCPLGYLKVLNTIWCGTYFQMDKISWIRKMSNICYKFSSFHSCYWSSDILYISVCVCVCACVCVFLGAFQISYEMWLSVLSCLSICREQLSSHRWIFMKTDTGDYYEKSFFIYSDFR
jgi:hypothetical protein